MRTWVTGGAGFIGSHLVDALIARGDEVTVIDNLVTGRRENLNPAARFLELDVAAGPDPAGSGHDPAGVGSRLEVAGSDVDVVFHLAAQIDVRRAVVDPAFDAAVNVAGTAAVLEAARVAGAQRFVLASTGGAIYGEADVVPTPEDAPQRPMSPYGTAKAAAELYVDLYNRLHGLSGMAVRFANVYGPRQDPRLEGGVIAIFCDAARDGRRGTVFGDGGQTRDFVYVGDVVAALLAAASSDETAPCNVGTGVETSVNELAAALSLPVDQAPERLGEVRRSCLDPSRAAERLGWVPAIELREGLELTARGG